MPHLSKKKLEKRYFDQLIEEWLRSLERSSRQSKMKSVAFEFFTYTERAMFAKRLAVIAMLSKGITSYAIADALNMSPATVERMSLKHERGKYEALEKFAIGKKDIWALVDRILALDGWLPPKAGGSRWRKTNRLMRDQDLLET